MFLTVTLLLSTVMPAPADDGAARAVLHFPDTVLTQILPNGDVAGCGPQWKMIVAPDRATFTPVLGMRAPRNLPVEFGIPTIRSGDVVVEGAAGEPRLDGNRASVDHGDFTSVYDFEVGFVEQSFIIHRLPHRGEFTVHVPYGTELAASDAAAGLQFVIPGLGRIDYGDATIFDRAGRSVRAPSELRAGGIEIRVPAAFVAHAEFPIVVDPAITPILDIDESGSSFNSPDVAWDSVHDLYTVIFKRQNSTTEADLFVNRVVASTGAVLTIAAVDLTSNNTTLPAIANATNNQNYLCVWRKDPDGIFDDIEIRGAIVTTGGGATTSFNISSGSSNEDNPDVGGSFGSFLVVWQEDPTIGGGGRNIVARTVNAGSQALGSKIDVANGSLDEVRPRVSRHAINGQWAVVYQVDVDSSNRDIRAALFNGGSLAVTNFAVSVSLSTRDQDPDVAQMDNEDFVFAWDRVISGSNTDIMTRRLGANSVSFQASTNIQNLTELEGGSTLTQGDVRVCANGTRVAYLYNENGAVKFTSANYDGSVPVLIEERLNVNTNQQEGFHNIAARGHTLGTVDQFLVVFSAGGSVLGQFFETTTPGGASFVQTGCGGAQEPKLSVTPNVDPLICEPFSIGVSGFAKGLLVVGTPSTLPLCPNQGGCALGATPTIITPLPNGTLTFTLPCDPALLNVTIAMTGISLASPDSLTTLCGPPKFASFFRTSDTLILDFQ